MKYLRDINFSSLKERVIMKITGKILISVVAVALMCAFATTAQAQKCGYQIPAGVTTVLKADMDCSFSPSGLTANNEATLDCAGFGIYGSGSTPGIRIDKVKNFKLVNCTIGKFWRGIEVNGSSGITIQDNDIQDNDVGAYLMSANGLTMTGNWFDLNTVDLNLEVKYPSAGVLAYDNRFSARDSVKHGDVSGLTLDIGKPVLSDSNVLGGKWKCGNSYEDLRYKCARPIDEFGEYRYDGEICTAVNVPTAGQLFDRCPLHEPELADPIEQIVKLSAMVVKIGIENSGIVNSLEAKVVGVMKVLEAAKKNDKITATNKLGAFDNEVEAQRGKMIDDSQADTLLKQSAAAQSAIDEM